MAPQAATCRSRLPEAEARTDRAREVQAPNAPINSKKTYKLDVTVLKIEQGTIGDFKSIELDAAQKKSTPYYVSVRVSNPGPEVPVKDDDPDVRFDGIDDRGQEQRSLTFIGTFERCDDKNAPTPFTNGKSYESCLVYLIPGGGSIQQVIGRARTSMW